MGDWYEAIGYQQRRSEKLARHLLNAIMAAIFPFLIVILLPYAIPFRFGFAVIVSVIAGLTAIIITDTETIIVYSNTIKRSQLMFVMLYTGLILITALSLGTPFEPVVLASRDLTRYLPSFLVTVLLTSFMPGYAIVVSVMEDATDTTERLVYSILSSFLVTGCIGFISWNLSAMALSKPILVATNLLILAVYVIYNIISERPDSISSERSKTKMSIMNAIVLVVLSLFLYLTYFTVHNIFESSLPIVGDEFDHVAYIAKLLSNSVTWQEDKLGILTTPSYPYLFHLFMAVCVTISGIAVADYLLLSALILLPLPMLAFYVMSKTVTGNSKQSIVATVLFQVTSDFGWLIAISSYSGTNDLQTILSVSNDTCSIIFSLWLPIIVAPYLIDLAAFLLIMGLMFNKNADSGKLVTISTILLIISILSHMEKALIIAGLTGILSLIGVITSKRGIRTKEIGAALVLASIVVIVIDLVALRRLFTAYYIATLVVCIVAGELAYLVSDRHFNSKSIQNWLTYNYKPTAIVATLLFVGTAYLEFIFGKTPGAHCSWIPLFLIPLKLGIVGVLAGIWLLKLDFRNARKHGVLLVLVSCVILGEIGLYHAGIPFALIVGSILDEFRYVRDVVWPIFSLAGSVALFVLVERIQRFRAPSFMRKITKGLVPSLVIGLLLASSIPSHLLKIQYNAANSGINQNIEPVVEFMDTLNITDGGTVYAPANLARSVAAVTGAIVYSPSTSVYGPLLSDGSDIYTTLWLLNYLNVQYMILDKPNSIVGIGPVAEMSPILYSDSAYRVCQVLTQSGPTLTSSTALVDDHVVERFGEEIGFGMKPSWQESFSNVSNWVAAPMTFTNVLEYSLTTNEDGEAQLMASGVAGSKTVMLYQMLFDAGLQVEKGTYIGVRFKTSPGAKLLVQILYNDRTMSNARLGSTPYLQSEDWISLTTYLDNVGANVTGLRIGLTNIYNEDVSELNGSIDYLVINREDSNRADAAILLSMTNLNFTTISSWDSILEAQPSVIIASEDSTYGNLTSFFARINEDSRVILLGNLNESSSIQDYIDITNLNCSTVADSLVASDETWNIPSMRVDCISISGGLVLSTYAGNQNLPFHVRLFVNDTRQIDYLNVWPLIEAIRGTGNEDALGEAQLALTEYLQIQLMLPSCSYIERKFYLKNSGFVRYAGTLEIETTGLILPHILQNESLGSLTNASILVVEGEARFEPAQFGYLIISISGRIQVYGNAGILNDLEVEEWSAIARIVRISANASVHFSSFTSSFPYAFEIYSSEYVLEGLSNLSYLPMSQGVLLIYANDPTVFGW
ncbi:MAG: hypothetical protein EAX81_01250 [Candidatus Thorarchaeota archaeon]|nr:hypothetical protein [Candidatus Thorarchaeota archaeon]